ncbi:hypothetical protein BH10CHL1_BH10CHL1_06890 [soil metagenome]
MDIIELDIVAISDPMPVTATTTCLRKVSFEYQGVGKLTYKAGRQGAARSFSRLKNSALLLVIFCMFTACNDATPAPTATPRSAPRVLATPGLIVEQSQPLAQAQAAPPVRLMIPALKLNVAVTPMAWQVTEVAGERRAIWQVPEDQAGWHVNSVGAGAQGNVVISGHHRQGKAVFAGIARGEVVIGQQILLSNQHDQTFVYQVTEISAPIPVSGATAADQAQATAYLAPSTQAKLTLVTGWPEFSDTHYLFVVADFSGILP